MITCSDLRPTSPWKKGDNCTTHTEPIGGCNEDTCRAILHYCQTDIPEPIVSEDVRVLFDGYEPGEISEGDDGLWYSIPCNKYGYIMDSPFIYDISQ